MKRLPKCAVLTCLNEADPRWFAHDANGCAVMICDGHESAPRADEVAIDPPDLAERIERNDFLRAPADRMSEHQIPCLHTRTVRGKDAPRIWGSWRTQICLDCGAFRMHAHNEDPSAPPGWNKSAWRPAAQYEEATAGEPCP